MKNTVGAIILAGLCAILPNPSVAGETNEWQHQAQLQLESFRKNLGASKSYCSLGFLGAGSPVIITRISPLFQGTGLLESDQLLAVNGTPVRGASELRSALRMLDPRDRVTLTVERGQETVEIHTACQDATPVFNARIDALTEAADGHWDECVKKTYLEELHWGGANSQSAGLRLWCHRARVTAEPEKWKLSATSAYLTQIDAQFMYEHANLLLEEMQYVPGGVRGLQSVVASRIQQIDESGHWQLSSQLRTKLASVETL
jgi:hypothetical protein